MLLCIRQLFSVQRHSNSEQAVEEVCANCGIAEVDETKFKACACNLVKYCSDGCREVHRPEHIGACKKRAAQLRDDTLFTQPDESHLGECPICCLPMPLDQQKSKLNCCCCKRICNGCYHADKMREDEAGMEQKCPFCREPMPKSMEEAEKMNTERVKANDPAALCQMGMKCCNEGNYEGAVEHLTKAAELGNIMAHYNLSFMYAEGEGVERDLKKKVYHLEEAAIGGHPSARYNLGCHEGRNGRPDRAVKHFIIAAKLGHDRAWEEVEKGFQMGWAYKEDYEVALRGYQAAVDATKSKQRKEAEKAKREGSYHTL